jgi:hypothetical protein
LLLLFLLLLLLLLAAAAAALTGRGPPTWGFRRRLAGRARRLYRGGVDLFAKHMRDSGLPADVPVGKLTPLPPA